jgi:hypothetical protein
MTLLRWKLMGLALSLAACAPMVPKRARTFLTQPPSLRLGLDLNLQSPPQYLLAYQPSEIKVGAAQPLDALTRARLVDIHSYVAERRPLLNGDPVVIVLGDQQRLYLSCLDRDQLWVDAIYKVSTGERGFSECGAEESKSPVGLHVVYDKHGSGLPQGQVMKSRLDMGILSVVSNDASHPVYASVTTRVLWLGGREPSNRDSYVNLIYIHGTPREYALGRPDSWGCIRMGNQDVVSLYDRVPENTPVYIDPRKF